ncbi:MAG: dihydrofolate reductase [Porticoccaceae bacterium]
MVTVSLIVAVSNNGVIGVKNQLPWHLPEDLKYFKAVTMGKPIVMGRKTFESIGRPLPGRSNIVVTSSQNWHSPGLEVCHSLEAALELARRLAAASGMDEVMVIGGEQIYRQSINLADRIYMTKVNVDMEGDAFFPELDAQGWDERVVRSVEPEGEMPGYSFRILDKVSHTSIRSSPVGRR